MARRRMLHLPALLGTLAAAVFLACAAALLTVSEKAEATFPGKNGRIVYASDVGYAYGETDGNIYTINPGGGGKTKLTAGTFPTYSPDGKKIAYSTHEPYLDPDIYTIKAGGGGKTKLTHTRNHDSDPAYSPDGKKIAFTRTTYDGEGGKLDEIYTVNSGGGGSSKVTTGSAPSYSPDGKRIVYTDYDNYHKSYYQLGDKEIYTINIRGGDKTRLTHNKHEDSFPSYSPNGERIAYGEYKSGESTVIYTIKVGGGDKTKLTAGAHPAYSPDGKKIAYTKAQKIAGDDPVCDIYTQNVGGGGKFRVTHTNSVCEAVPSWGSRP